jgi:hypothetical protein
MEARDGSWLRHSRGGSSKGPVGSRSHITADDQSVCQGIDPTLGLATKYCFLCKGCFLKLSLWGALSDERSGLSFVFLSLVIYQYSHQTFTLHVFYSSAIYIQYI